MLTFDNYMYDIENMSVGEYLQQFNPKISPKLLHSGIPTMDASGKVRTSLIEVVSGPNIGKTSLAFRMMKESQRMGFVPLYVNVASKDVTFFCNRYKINEKLMAVLHRDKLYELENFKWCKLIVLDSIRPLRSPRAVMDKLLDLYNHDRELTVLIINEFSIVKGITDSYRHDVMEQLCNKRFVLRSEGQLFGNKKMELYDMKTKDIYSYLIDKDGIVDHLSSVKLALLTLGKLRKKDDMVDEDILKLYEEVLNEQHTERR